MISKRNEDTAAKEAAQDTVPDDLAAVAFELREAAETAAEQAIQRRAEAEAVVATARADADERIRQGHADALPLIADANALERKTAELGERSQRHKEAASREALAARHEARGADLAAELEQVTETIAELDTRLAELGEQRQDLEARLAGAEAATDVGRIAEFTGLIGATGNATTTLTAQRTAAQARADQIGDGTDTGPGELLDALRAAASHRKALTDALDHLYPHRPGAEHRRNLADLKGALEGNLARLADEARAGQQSPRQSVVRL